MTDKQQQSEYIMYHKPNCNTSLMVLKALKEIGIKPQLRLYLEDVPTAKELGELLKKLNIPVSALIRTKEPIYKENYADKKLTKAQWLKVLHENPILINRPILIKGDKASFAKKGDDMAEILKSIA